MCGHLMDVTSYKGQILSKGAKLVTLVENTNFHLKFLFWKTFALEDGVQSVLPGNDKWVALLQISQIGTFSGRSRKSPFFCPIGTFPENPTLPTSAVSWFFHKTLFSLKKLLFFLFFYGFSYLYSYNGSLANQIHKSWLWILSNPDVECLRITLDCI